LPYLGESIDNELLFVSALIKMWQEIAAKISETTEKPFEITSHRSVGGGCINQSYAVSNGDRTYFVKVNQANQLEMFAAEYLGLQQMYETQTIRIPQPLDYGSAGNNSFIVMEWLEFGRGDSRAWELMGQNLAKLHQSQGSDRFGWDRNNTIGSTPQINPWNNNWPEFLPNSVSVFNCISPNAEAEIFPILPV
jgi:fructosamine-3-kinase